MALAIPLVIAAMWVGGIVVGITTADQVVEVEVVSEQ